jgi:hypothetical protein
VRKRFDPQLRELWHVHPALSELRFRRYWPRSGGFYIESHHRTEEERQPIQVNDGDIDLLADQKLGGKSFFPLVRSSLLLTCSLKILFLRKETPGKIYHGGDIDNRIKTLLDGLCVPRDQSMVIQDDNNTDEPMFCLLEDDALISGLSVDTQMLLTGENASPATVHLVIEVVVRAQAQAYNGPGQRFQIYGVRHGPNMRLSIVGHNICGRMAILRTTTQIAASL